MGIAAWGKDMIMDKGEREAFLDGMQEQVNQSGTANFVGEQAGVMLGSLLVGRLGIKGGPNLKPDTDGDGGSSKSSDEGMGNVQTGGRELSVYEYLKRLDTADAMYESFRKSDVDAQSIAKNTGMSENRVQRIKDHLFFKEHIKEHGVGRFEADYDIAQAWERLQKGTFKQQDIDLLNHELFESKFEGIFKTDYRTAHDRTVDSGRPWNPPEEE